VIIGRERHVASAREGNLPYPMRALRKHDFLYIRNFEPDRWPMGSPGEAKEDELEGNTHAGYSDMDASPTKAWLIQHRDDPQWKPFFERAFGKRPGEELYDLTKDPDQIENVAANPEDAAKKRNCPRNSSGNSKPPGILVSLRIALRASPIYQRRARKAPENAEAVAQFSVPRKARSFSGQSWTLSARVGFIPKPCPPNRVEEFEASAPFFAGFRISEGSRCVVVIASHIEKRRNSRLEPISSEAFAAGIKIGGIDQPHEGGQLVLGRFMDQTGAEMSTGGKAHDPDALAD